MLSQEHVSLQTSPISSAQWLQVASGSHAEWERPEFLGASICRISQNMSCFLDVQCGRGERGKSFVLGHRKGMMESPWGYGLLHAPQIYIAVLLIFTAITVFRSTLPYNLWLPGWLLLRHEYKTCAPVNGPVHATSSSPHMALGLSPFFPICCKCATWGKKWSQEWSQLLILAMKRKCMLCVHSKSFVLRWQFYRKNCML